MANVTWKQLIEREMKNNDDSYDNIEFTQTGEHTNDLYPKHTGEGRWDEFEFDNSYGLEAGMPFLVYTEKRIYFAVCYDGSEWVGSVPRNPDTNYKPRHFGGG